MTIREAASIYTTIALPTDRTETTKEVVGDNVWYSKKSVITSEAREWINSLEDTYPEVLDVYQQQFISAYSKGLRTLVSAEEEGAYASAKDMPYTNAAFVVTIESMDYDEVAGTVDVTAKIKEALLLHQGYQLPEVYLRFIYQYFSEDELNAADLKVGGTYLVFGQNYSDHNLELIINIAESFKITTNEVDWKYLNLDIEEVVTDLNEHDYDTSDIAAIYEYGGSSRTISYTDLEAITSSWMFVQDPANFLRNGYIRTYNDGTVETVAATEEEIKAATLPTIVRLTTEADTFLNSGEGKLWRETIEQYKITNQSVPVIGTDLLDSVFEFHQNKAIITSGRSFTKEEYTSGSRVCLISESLSLANDLQVGDTIPMAFYQGDRTYLENTYNPPADPYSPIKGFCTEEEPFRIIGIYRQSNLWGMTSYTFTPNTIFVPNKSITCESYTDQTGLFYTIVLKNGSIEKMKTYAEELGFNDMLSFYDQGYSAIKDTLSDYLSTTRVLSVIGIIIWVAMLILFLVLYVTRFKQTAGMMLSLGAGRKNTIIHILTSSLMLVMIATTMSGIFGYTLLGSIIDYVYSSTSSQAITNTVFSASIASDPSSVVNLTVQKLPLISVAVVIAQFAIFALVIWGYGYYITNKKPLALMKHKEN
jgi:hypothetical protein